MTNKKWSIRLIPGVESGIVSGLLPASSVAGRARDRVLRRCRLGGLLVVGFVVVGVGFLRVGHCAAPSTGWGGSMPTHSLTLAAAGSSQVPVAWKSSDRVPDDLHGSLPHLRPGCSVETLGGQGDAS